MGSTCSHPPFSTLSAMGGRAGWTGSAATLWSLVMFSSWGEQAGYQQKEGEQREDLFPLGGHLQLVVTSTKGCCYSQGDLLFRTCSLSSGSPSLSLLGPKVRRTSLLLVIGYFCGSPILHSQLLRSSFRNNPSPNDPNLSELPVSCWDPTGTDPESWDIAELYQPQHQ